MEEIIFFNLIISSASFLISISISLIPRAVNFCSLSSKIAFTCSSVKEYNPFVFLDSTSEIIFWDLLIFHLVFNIIFFASSGFFDALIILIILSKFSTETDKPINICALSSAFCKSNLVFLITTSSLKFKKFDKKSFRLHVSGLPSTIAKVLKPMNFLFEYFYIVVVLPFLVQLHFWDQLKLGFPLC